MWAGLCDGAHSLGRWHPAHAGPSDSEVASCSAVADSSAPLSWPACPTPLLGLGVLLRDINTSRNRIQRLPRSPSTVLTFLSSIKAPLRQLQRRNRPKCRLSSLVQHWAWLAPGSLCEGSVPPLAPASADPGLEWGSHPQPWILLSLGGEAHICNSSTREAGVGPPLVRETPRLQTGGHAGKEARTTETGFRFLLSEALEKMERRVVRCEV